jgi:hypothetical protein
MRLVGVDDVMLNAAHAHAGEIPVEGESIVHGELLYGRGCAVV